MGMEQDKKNRLHRERMDKPSPYFVKLFSAEGRFLSLTTMYLKNYSTKYNFDHAISYLLTGIEVALGEVQLSFIIESVNSRRFITAMRNIIHSFNKFVHLILRNNI